LIKAVTIFAIIAPAPSAALQSAIKRDFPNKNMEFAPGQFVVSASGLTAHQVSEKLGLDGAAGQFVVFSVASHFGYHRKDLWEWLSVNSS
jgi:hypothetical protein